MGYLNFEIVIYGSLKRQTIRFADHGSPFPFRFIRIGCKNIFLKPISDYAIFNQYRFTRNSQPFQPKGSMYIFSLSSIACLFFCSVFMNPENHSVKKNFNQNIKTDKPQVTNIKTEEVFYSSNGKQARGYIAWDENIKGKRPVVIIVHEWWGLNDYARSRARQIAELGYFAFDADLFGNGQLANNPDEARALTKPYYSNPENTLQPIEDAIAKAATFPQADISKTAAMGYCFGGFVVVNAAKQGAPLLGVVSFHGRLVGLQPKKNMLKAEVLICQGGDDEFVPMTDQLAFKKSMDSIGALYHFISYPGAKHAYTNPEATALGIKFNMPIAYNGPADTASWKDMQEFFLKVFKQNK